MGLPLRLEPAGGGMVRHLLLPTYVTIGVRKYGRTMYVFTDFLYVSQRLGRDQADLYVGPVIPLQCFVLQLALPTLKY